GVEAHDLGWADPVDDTPREEGDDRPAGHEGDDPVAEILRLEHEDDQEDDEGDDEDTALGPGEASGLEVARPIQEQDRGTVLGLDLVRAEELQPLARDDVARLAEGGIASPFLLGDGR